MLSAGSLARTSRQTKQAIGTKYTDANMAILLCAPDGDGNVKASHAQAYSKCSSSRGFAMGTNRMRFAGRHMDRGQSRQCDKGHSLLPDAGNPSIGLYVSDG